MAKHVSETPATQWLKHKKVVYSEHPYDYVEHGGTSESSKKLGVPEHAVVKTLVIQDEHGKYSFTDLSEPLLLVLQTDRVAPSLWH